MKGKTKRRICTGIVTTALGVMMIGGTASAALTTKQAVSGGDDANVTATISMRDKGDPVEGKYLYTYAGCLGGYSYPASSEGVINIYGAARIDKYLTVKDRYLQANSGYSKNNSITAYAKLYGESGRSTSITK